MWSNSSVSYRISDVIAFGPLKRRRKKFVVPIKMPNHAKITVCSNMLMDRLNAILRQSIRSRSLQWTMPLKLVSSCFNALTALANMAMHDANAKTNNSNSDNSLDTYEKHGRAHVRGNRQTAGNEQTRATWSMEYKNFRSSCSHSNMNNKTLSSP